MGTYTLLFSHVPHTIGDTPARTKRAGFFFAKRQKKMENEALSPILHFQFSPIRYGSLLFVRIEKTAVRLIHGLPQHIL